MKLKGKTALITGGGSGIGAAITERFVAEGAKVCITGRRKEKLEQEAAAFSSKSVVTCPGDVSIYDDVKRMVAVAAAFGDRIDVLVNNAASDVMGPITELDPDDWRRVLEINLTGPFLLMRETIPHMISNGGGFRHKHCFHRGFALHARRSGIRYVKGRSHFSHPAGGPGVWSLQGTV